MLHFLIDFFYMGHCCRAVITENTTYSYNIICITTAKTAKEKKPIKREWREKTTTESAVVMVTCEPSGARKG